MMEIELVVPPVPKIRNRTGTIKNLLELVQNWNQFRAGTGSELKPLSPFLIKNKQKGKATMLGVQF